MQNLTKKNYFAYAMQVYDNPSCSGIEEFQSDLMRIKYIKRLINRYVRTGELIPRLLLNHIIGVYNVFQATAVSRLLFFRADPESWSALKTILSYLNLMPEEILPIEGVMILNKDIPRDEVLWDMLKDTVDNHATTR